MIPYEDLVNALTHWRASQGLPTAPVSFLAQDSGNVDLALPLSPAAGAEEEAVEAIGTEEIESLESFGDDAYEADAQGDEYAAEASEDAYASSEPLSEEPIAEDAPPSEYAADEYVAEEFAAAADEVQDEATIAAPDIDAIEADLGADEGLYGGEEQTAIAEGFEGSAGLAYDDEDETQYGGLPPEDMEDPATMVAQPETEEAEILAADDMPVEEVAIGDADLAVESEQEAAPDLSTEPIDALVDEGLADLGQMDSEQTAIGIGIDDIVPPADDEEQ